MQQPFTLPLQAMIACHTHYIVVFHSFNTLRQTCEVLSATAAIIHTDVDK